MQAIFVAAQQSRRPALGMPGRHNAAMQVFYATQFVLPLPPGHRFPMGKYRLLRDRLAAELPQIRLMPAEPATDGQLALVHTPAYIQGITDGSVDAAVMR